ncbi:hypothetical protein [Paucidesulfovibrio longus]|uniref:hypothetical protein n=1 Tax=Paucidesulfovibrio longus TaxID=889 RepID=UPI0003B7118E|nr:hypothetical protein [Paucidesulfovibrio longus]
MALVQRTKEECIELLRQSAKAVEPGQKIKADVFQPQDAENVARLYYAIYGDNFPLDYVYDPERLRAANAGPDVQMFVGRAESGDVVGLAGLYRSAPGKGAVESGGLMVLPDYRNGFLALRLTKMTYVAARDELQVNMLFGQSVTDETTMQKVNRKYDMRELALEIESMPPKRDSDARISLLCEFTIFRDIPHAVHPHPAYEDYLRDAYGQLGVEREFAPGVDPAGITDCAFTSMDNSGIAKIQADALGADLPDRLAELEALHPGMHAYHAQLPLADPGLPWAVERAWERGYVLGGLLPLWSDRDVLMLQKFASRPDFSAPKLLADDTKALLERIREEYELSLKESGRP